MPENLPHPAEPERSQQRRNQILDAAACGFSRFGFHGCSMAQLAKESGMSVGHIYHYFHNKEAIIDAIVQRDLSESLDYIHQIGQSDNIYESMLNNLSDPINNSCLNPKNAALQFEILAEAARNPKVAAMIQSAHLRIKAKVCELLQRGSRIPMSRETLDSKFEIIGALFDGLMVRLIRNPDLIHFNRDALMAILRSAMRQILEDGHTHNANNQKQDNN